MADEENAPEESPEGAPEEASVDPAVEEGLEGVAEAAGEAIDAAEAVAASPARTVEFIKEVPLAVTVEVGRSRMTIQDLLQLGQGSVVELTKLAGDPLDIFINGKQVAYGEAVIVNEKFGIRLTEIISPEERLKHV